MEPVRVGEIDTEEECEDNSSDDDGGFLHTQRIPPPSRRTKCHFPERKTGGELGVFSELWQCTMAKVRVVCVRVITTRSGPSLHSFVGSPYLLRDIYSFVNRSSRS